MLEANEDDLISTVKDSLKSSKMDMNQDRDTAGELETTIDDEITELES